MKRLIGTDARIDARIAIIELRSLLAADAVVSLSRRSDLIRKASYLVRSPEKRTIVAEQLGDLIEQRFGRNPETFQPSPATEEALRLLSALQNGVI
jgi:hypothetical protein